MSDSLPLHGLQPTRLPCLLPSPRTCSNSCALSQWCHSTISFSPLSSSSPPAFSSGLALCIRWPKYYSFSFGISPSNEYSGLISFRIDWFDKHVKWPSSEPGSLFLVFTSACHLMEALEESHLNRSQLLSLIYLLLCCFCRPTAYLLLYLCNSVDPPLCPHVGSVLIQSLCGCFLLTGPPVWLHSTLPVPSPSNPAREHAEDKWLPVLLNVRTGLL